MFGQLSSKSVTRLRKTRRESKRYVLIHEDPPHLAYREKNDSLSLCVRSHEIVTILHRFHDSHGHFSVGVMSRNILGRYYWPGRLQDIARWCVSSDSCQRMGPLRSSTQIKPIMSLQPLDLLGMDFLGPINPASRNGSKYILLVVDYFSRYLFAQATERSTGAAVVGFLRQISNIFGWPLALYVDNGSHFVKGELPKLLQETGTLLFTAPISNPRSVGLSERYVQMVLAGLRVRVAANSINPTNDVTAMEKWEDHLEYVVQAINTRILRIHGFTPSQLLFGFNARFHPLDQMVVEELRTTRLKSQIEEGGGMPISLNDVQEFDLRLAQVEEARELTRERVLCHLEDQELSAVLPRYAAPQVGDLVLRRRVNVDKSLGMKFDTRWDGPYRLVRISASGVSGDIVDLKTDNILGKYALDSLKVFVPKEQMRMGPEWVSLAEGLRQKAFEKGSVNL